MRKAGADVQEQRRETVARVFGDAVERTPLDRAAYLDAACAGDADIRAEVDSLLAAYDASQAFLEPPDDLALSTLRDDDAEQLRPPERVGAYRLVQLIGCGGTGAVYLAERADGRFTQRVALKLLRDDVASKLLVRRFLREHHILARLDHPNIARLLDAGATNDGRPYLVMEYVDGVPLTKYCDEQKLSLEARLRLFMDVCAAVHYAHRQLIVHRDLKPANILVSTDARVKLLDFGIAKLLDPGSDAGGGTLTEIGFRAMTPEYAAPEQIRGEPVTTATDVYALGALLYELLCGRQPHVFRERRLEAMARAVDEIPRAPSMMPSTEHGPRLRISRDLDAIALTALRPEPERRYASADALREDVRRHLARLPVTARGDSALYRTSRFIRRHRAAVAAGGLTLASLLAGLTGTLWQARAAARERDLALREADKAARVSSFMSDLFFFADPGQSRGQEVTVREALDSGRVWMKRELSGQPELYVEMAAQLGEVFFRLGDYQQAHDVWEAGLSLAIEHDGEVSEPVLRVMLLLVKVLEDLGQNDATEMFARRALAIQQQLPELRNDDFATTHVLLRLGRALWRQDGLEEAETVLRRSLAILPRAHPEAPHRRTVLLTALAHVRRAAGDPVEAERLLRESLVTRRAVWGEEHPEVAQVLMNLGGAIADQGRYAEAEGLALQAVSLYRRLVGESHPDVALALESLADIARRKGDAAAASQLYRQVLQLQPRSLPRDHPRRAATLFALGLSLLEQQRPTEAEPVLREALDVRRRLAGQGPPKADEIMAALTTARERRADR